MRGGVAGYWARSRSGRWAGIVGGGVICLFVLAAALGPLIEPHAPNQPLVGSAFQGPSAHYWFGTDQLGRDEFSRVVAGAGIALGSALGSVVVALVLGAVLGVVSGYRGGSWMDYGVSRGIDLLFAFPEYVLAIIVIAILGPGLINAALAIGIVYTPRFARVVRVATIEVMHCTYVEAARLAGRGRGFIVIRHVLPNVTSPLLVITALSLSSAEGAYAALSFLGFGVPPPQADYGSMLGAAEPYLSSDPWLALFPSMALVLLILGFNLFGDWLRDLLSRR